MDDWGLHRDEPCHGTTSIILNGSLSFCYMLTPSQLDFSTYNFSSFAPLSQITHIGNTNLLFYVPHVRPQSSLYNLHLSFFCMLSLHILYSYWSMMALLIDLSTFIVEYAGYSFELRCSLNVA